MSQLLVVGEDALSCALGERLVARALPDWRLARESIATGGVTRLVAALPRYANLARHLYPVLCIADTDGDCPVDLIQGWTPSGATDDLMIRLAVTEAESWLLADRHAAAQFFDVPVARVPMWPDELPDPKATVLQLAAKSKVKLLRQEVVSEDLTRPGAGYVVHMRRFILSQWDPARAAAQSPSLDRALNRMTDLAKGSEKP